jgi:DNA-binding protein HU-beta
MLEQLKTFPPSSVSYTGPEPLILLSKRAFGSGASLGERRISNMAATKMTQAQLIRKIAETHEISNKTAKAVLETLSETAISETKKNGMFVIPGIGKLVRQERKARMGRNPATGESIKIPAKKVVKFRIAKACKDAIVPPKVKK